MAGRTVYRPIFNDFCPDLGRPWEAKWGPEAPRSGKNCEKDGPRAIFEAAFVENRFGTNFSSILEQFWHRF